MPLPMRVQDIADLLKLLTQATQGAVPDNPAEQLSDYVPAPGTGSEDLTVADGVSFPNAGHSGAYQYGNASSLYAKAQYG